MRKEEAGKGRAPKGRQVRHGSILLAVMVLITLAALVGTTVLYRADAQRGSAANAMERAQLRALAWSGVQAAMAELSSQRSVLMQSGSPTLTASWDLYSGTTLGNVRLVPIGPAGALAVSEGGKLDVNIATTAMLAHLPGVGDAMAAKFVAARGPGLGSAEELGTIDGLSAELLYGSGAPPADGANGESSHTPSLLSLTTVFSFDPNAGDGIGPDAGAELARVNVSGGWSDELAAELRQRMSPQAVGVLQTVLKSSKPAHDSDLIAGLRGAKAPVELWGEVLEGVTTSDEEFRRGRVDLNSAPAEVLACVPGIDQGAASKIVESRARLDDASRRRVTWPLKEGVLKEDQFQSAVDWVTVRSLQWRVRVEARIERGEAPASASNTKEAEESPPGMVWEAVIDVSGGRARAAYLRDVTYLPALAQRARDQEKAGTPTPGEGAGADPQGQPEDHAEGIGSLHMDKLQPSTGLRSQKLDFDTDLKLEGMKGSGRLNVDTDLKLVGETRSNPEADGEDGSPQQPAAPKDRRIGRWRAPSKE